MTKRILLFLLFASPLAAQYTPPPVAAYDYNGSAWAAITSTYTGQALTYTPPAAALYCYNSSLSQWVPATSTCLGGGGGGSVTSTGTTGHIPIFTTATNIGNSIIDFGVTTANVLTVNAVAPTGGIGFNNSGSFGSYWFDTGGAGFQFEATNNGGFTFNIPSGSGVFAIQNNGTGGTAILDASGAVQILESAPAGSMSIQNSGSAGTTINDDSSTGLLIEETGAGPITVAGIPGIGTAGVMNVAANGTLSVGAASSGTVTSIATTSPITGGTITGAGTIACATCVAATSPGAGIARFAGSTQTVTSAELSGDATTSGSNAVTVVKINGTSLAALASGILYNTTTTGVPSIATASQILTACTGCAPLASPTFTGTVTYPLIATSTKCAATGTAANPSVASCSAAPAGFFSCATNASTGTCTVNTTAVTANSVIQIQPDSSLGTALSVTCNTTADSGLTAPRVSARSAGTSFTITLGTFTSNPQCFSFLVIN